MRNVTPEIVQENEEHKDLYIKEILKYLPEPLLSTYESLNPEYLTQSEVTLKTLLKPSEQMEAIRTRIWSLISQRSNSPNPSRIQLSEICHGIAPLPYVEQVLQVDLMAAWCGVPTMDYETRVESMLDKAYARMEEILDLPLMNNGKLDVKAANLILQVAKMVDLRSKGNYTERVEQKTLQVSTSVSEMKREIGQMTLEQIDQQIKLLEGKE